MQHNKWFHISKLKKDGWPLALCGTVLCDCAGDIGARIVMTGGRIDGQLIHDCSHEVEITHFMILDKPPPH